MNNKLFEQIAQAGSDLSPSERSVVQMLVFYSNDKGECWPRTRKLAARVHLSLRRVQKVLKSLRDKGYVVVLQEATAYTPPTYRITVPREGDVVKDAAERPPESQRRVPQSRNAASFPVRAQAGTNINQLKEQKGDLNRDGKKEVVEYDPSKMVPCGKKGCNYMTVDGWCKDHRPVGFYSRDRAKGGRS